MDDADRERPTLRCRRLNGAPFRRRGERASVPDAVTLEPRPQASGGGRGA